MPKMQHKPLSAEQIEERAVEVLDEIGRVLDENSADLCACAARQVEVTALSAALVSNVIDALELAGNPVTVASVLDAARNEVREEIVENAIEGWRLSREEAAPAWN